MLLSFARKICSLYSWLVRAKVYIQKVIQRWDAGMYLEKPHPAWWCWASSGRCAGGGYRESTLCTAENDSEQRGLQQQTGKPWGQAQIFNSTLKAPCVVLWVIGRCLPFLKSKSQSVGILPKLQHEAEVSSRALEKWPQDSLEWPS